jgi:hypothetical protein
MTTRSLRSQHWFGGTDINVFESKHDLMARVNDPDLDVDETRVLVQKLGGPRGGPGMPEWGQVPIPEKLLRQGVKDMVRVSDAGMSGTSYGTCVLHVAPESAARELDAAPARLHARVRQALPDPRPPGPGRRRLRLPPRRPRPGLAPLPPHEPLTGSGP